MKRALFLWVFILSSFSARAASPVDCSFQTAMKGLNRWEIIAVLFSLEDRIADAITQHHHDLVEFPENESERQFLKWVAAAWTDIQSRHNMVSLGYAPGREEIFFTLVPYVHNLGEHIAKQFGDAIFRYELDVRDRDRRLISNLICHYWYVFKRLGDKLDQYPHLVPVRLSEPLVERIVAQAGIEP